LLNRYEQSTMRACALLAALDSQQDESRLCFPLDEMEDATIYCEGRLRGIEAMKARYDGLLQAARDLLR
jgi:hypothetical protein